MADITSANSILLMSLPLLLPIPQQIQGFSTDDIFSVASIVPVETLMGADGNLSGGYTPREKKTAIVLQADSASGAFFDAWAAGQDAGMVAYQAVATLSLPSIGWSYALTTGFLTGYVPIPAGKKVLQPRHFEITWQTILGTPISISG